MVMMPVPLVTVTPVTSFVTVALVPLRTSLTVLVKLCSLRSSLVASESVVVLTVWVVVVVDEPVLELELELELLVVLVVGVELEQEARKPKPQIPNTDSMMIDFFICN